MNMCVCVCVIMCVYVCVCGVNREMVYSMKRNGTCQLPELI